ncbi:hypothetical protein B296_00010037 [Ensete ventricosum]|uniref:Uncharacterized protein n=1 Tax=Ensete ventricosum TaxID=4639 RepID=A0A427AL93_ENSVE|nr:hypothetical protein B296_00010037 [Ensete ventricosum]
MESVLVVAEVMQLVVAEVMSALVVTEVIQLVVVIEHVGVVNGLEMAVRKPEVVKSAGLVEVLSGLVAVVNESAEIVVNESAEVVNRQAVMVIVAVRKSDGVMSELEEVVVRNLEMVSELKEVVNALVVAMNLES